LKSRQYTLQLRWIDCNEAELEQAVNDFMRSSVDRTTWSEKGDVLESSFEEFSSRLERYWSSQRRLIGIELSGRSEIEIGQAVLTKCQLASVQLQGLEVPNYFVPGSYHALADTFAVGWHPKYEDMRKAKASSSTLATSDNNKGGEV